MNRRLRGPNAKALPSKIEERLHRYLRPGALARLRDSRISARSPRSTLKIPIPRLSAPSSPQAPPAAAAQMDGSPCFVIRTYGPRFPQRKKLVAAKSIFFVPSSPSGLEISDAAVDLFNSDLVVAH
ncbi:hypothetical protein COCNU_14G008080 [Cocos nucifera]|uniref:Uncharacterized protein n=1 Tax=Cocos nucifera TaxID=13894 RepID=A0A8K0IVE4_COCNU|nr:hypothetical protein COCNU_14G008080 [Cocos nucifera]